MYTSCKYIFYVFRFTDLLPLSLWCYMHCQATTWLLWIDRNLRNLIVLFRLIDKLWHSYLTFAFSSFDQKSYVNQNQGNKDDNLCIVICDSTKYPQSESIHVLHNAPYYGLGEWTWVLLVEILHGVDARVVCDLLQPPHSPGVSLMT